MLRTQAMAGQGVCRTPRVQYRDDRDGIRMVPQRLLPCLPMKYVVKVRDYQRGRGDGRLAGNHFNLMPALSVSGGVSWR